MAQQTAVDFFFTKVLGSLHISMSKTDIDELLIEAKQMEKEQIIEAFYEGMKTNPFDPNRGRGKMYYDETYKKD